jgi:hypothetical protein
MFIKPTQMGRYARVQSADDVEEDLLLCAHLLVVGMVEAVLLVDQFPDGTAVVVGERLYVCVDVKVLAPVVGLVLHVPHPA